MAVVWELAKSAEADEDKKATLLKWDEVLGLNLGNNSTSAKAAIQFDDLPSEIRELVTKREQMRQEDGYDAADELRAKIVEAGFEIEDTPGGPQLYKS